VGVAGLQLKAQDATRSVCKQRAVGLDELFPAIGGDRVCYSNENPN